MWLANDTRAQAIININKLIFFIDAHSSERGLIKEIFEDLIGLISFFEHTHMSRIFEYMNIR